MFNLRLIFESVLEEMFIHGNKQSKNIIAYRGDIWLMDDSVSNESFKHLMEKLGISDYDSSNDDTIDFWDIQDIIQNNERSDILVGYVNGKKELQLYNIGGLYFDPKSSILVKKVVNELKLRGVNQEDSDEHSTLYNKKKLGGVIGDIGYHGTSSKYLESILRVGIEARDYQSNYDHSGIYHSDRIFFSSRIGEAMMHGNHTSSNKGGKSIIIEFTIPDKNLVVSDYDVDKASGNVDYSDIGRDVERKLGSEKSLSMSREFGIYGYVGKILPMMIRYVYICNDDQSGSLSNYKRYTYKQLKFIMSRYGELYL